MVLAAALKQYTSFLEDEALWFRGAAAALDATGRSADIDHGHTHIDLLRRHEEQLLLRRVAVLSIAESAGASHTGEYLAAQARSSASALSDCFEAVRELRGALQAFDADCSAMRQALQHQAREASAPDQLDRALDDIFNRA